MENKKIIGNAELLYVVEHLTCKHYISDFHIGFAYNEIDEDKEVKLVDAYFHYFIFIIEGELIVSVDEFRDQSCKAGEMIFIAGNSDFLGFAKSGLKYLLLSFDNQFGLCEKLSLDSLQAFKPEQPVFSKLEIRKPLQVVVDSIKFYMQHKIRCRHLHAAKQQEVFLILTNFYTKEELASFLSPMLKKDLDFKTFILKNYQDVKTVEELAKLCNSSVRSLTRKFRIYFNDSPYSWMLKQRSHYIKFRIADPKVPFTDIVKEYGFSSSAHFTSYCRKYFGDSPSHLRKKEIALSCKRDCK